MALLKGMNKAVQGDYMNDPRLALALELQRSGSSTAPVRSPLEGLARALTGVVGAYNQKQVGDEYKAKGDGLTSALAGAMANPVTQTGVKPFIDPGAVDNPEMGTTARQGGQTLVAGVDPGMASLAAALKSNPQYGDNQYIQDAAQGYDLKALEDKTKMQNELMQKRQEYTDPAIMEAKLKLALAGRNAGPTDYQMMTLQDRRDKAAADAETKAQGKIDKDTERYSKQLTDSGVADLLTSLNSFKNNNSDENKDIAGFGATYAVPDFMASEDAVVNRQDVAAIRNNILKVRSGGAVTPQEAERLLQELGEGYTKSDAQLRRGIANIEKTLAEKLRNINAGYDPKVIDAYKERGGGVTLDRLGGGQPAQAAGDGLPKVGEVQDGFEFIGGDPSNPASWRQK